MFETTILTKRRLWILAILICVGFVVLFSIEAINYRYLAREEFEIPIDADIKKYPDINSYLTNVKDKYIYDVAVNVGCFDNDRLMEEIRGPGKTCKSIAPTITDIKYKPETPNEDDIQGVNPNYFITSDGEIKAYSEICPTTANTENPLRCLHNNVKKLDDIGKKVANVIDHVQKYQDNRLNNIDSIASHHIVDNQRLYNKKHTRDFLDYERALDMPEQTTDGITTAILQYAAVKRASAL